jgi:N-formylglutamate deformylase
MSPFRVQYPESKRVPILVSIPHCGTRFPEELITQYTPNLIQAPDDTDWFVNQLYDFAPQMGITVISAVYSRWVIDLNRDPENKPLYSDGRIITGLCPTTNFLGESIYADGRESLDPTEVGRRLKQYYWPYHNELTGLLESIKSEFGHVLIWDAHSIRAEVPTIYKGKFPDLILGDVSETSATPNIIEAAIKQLYSSNYSVRHNDPFKGGFITRHYGRPKEKQHALQLEMSKVNYMDDTETMYDQNRAEKIRMLLKSTFTTLTALLTNEAR